MSEPILDDFLNELDILCDARNTPATRRNCTCELLNAADGLFDASTIIKQRLSDGSFRENICGTTRIEEVVNGQVVNRPVVDLVQQGGTMLGIGLLGYTYIMEKAGCEVPEYGWYQCRSHQHFVTVGLTRKNLC